MNTPEYKKQYMQKYYPEHREQLLEKKRIDYRRRKASYSEKNREQYLKFLKRRLVYSAKCRAKKHGLPFSITINDFEIPEFCPVLGIKIENGLGKSIPNSPSIDRIIPGKGYTKQNIIVVSLKANQIKNCANLDELTKVYLFYKEVIENASMCS